MTLIGVLFIVFYFIIFGYTIDKISRGKIEYIIIYICTCLPIYITLQAQAFKIFNSETVVTIIKLSKDIIFIYAFVIFLFGKNIYLFERTFKFSLVDKLILWFTFLVTIYTLIPLGEAGKNPIRTLKSTVSKNFESNGLDSSVKLEKNDLVVVRKISGYTEIEAAKIVGLVKNQGEYALKDSSYSLYDILMDSGGILEDASIEGLSIERGGTIFSVDTSKLLESRGKSTRDNIILKSGDVITVPRIDNTIFIDGEVGSPKFISFQIGINLKKAVSQSGGFTPLSDRKGSYVEYQNGNIKSTKKFLFFNFYPKIKAGSKIFVPTKPEKTTAGGILNSVVGELLTIVTTLGTLGALLKSVN